MEFEVGDVIVLKSGSDRMTVEVVNTTHVSCAWMGANGVVREAFDKRMVEKWKPADPRGRGSSVREW